MKKSSAWTGLRKWFNPYTYLDSWFDLLERTRAGFNQWLDHGFLARHKPYQKKPSFVPQFDALEMRMLPTVSVFFHSSTQSVNYNATDAIIEVDLSSSTSTVTISVNYATSNGTAVAGTDYTACSGTLNYAPGASTVTFKVPMLDFLESGNKTLTISLSSPVNATIGSPSSETVTILNTPLPGGVVDPATNVVLPSNGTPINSFSNWSMALAAQVSGAATSSYSWSFASASDAGSISGSSTYKPTFTWGSFTGAARSDTISLTEVATITGSGGSEDYKQSYLFTVAGTDSPAWSTAPTSSSTWKTVVAPDQLNGQDMVPAGPYAAIGLVDGSVQTGISLPSYNPNAAPLGLDYNSAVADPNPIFLVNYALSSSASVPTTVTAQLTMTNQSSTTVFTGSTIYYSPSSLNKGGTMEIALQASGLTMATGRYNWQIVTTANYSPTVTTTYSGSFNFIDGSTTPTSLTNNPFGPGWSPDDIEHLWSATGGVIIQNPNGNSLWFASSGGSYTAPAGDFSTLSLTGGVYTRTMPDGTQIMFNSSGQQTNIVDRNGNTTTFAYSASGQLTSVTDMNGQINTITYNATTGLASSVADPASRSLALAYTSSELTSITDPNSNVWTYGYDASDRLTTIKDPRYTSNNYTTTFTYNFASQATTVRQPDLTTQTFAPEQLTGLATPGTGTSGSPSTGALAAAAFATYTDPNSHIWTEYFDGLGMGQTVEAIDPLGDTALTYRDANALPWLVADPLGRRDRLFFDTSGNVVTMVHSDDSYNTATFNSYAEPLTSTNYIGGNAYTTSYSYDSSGNLTAVTDPLYNTTTYTYTTSGVKGLLQTVTKPLELTNAGLYTTTYAYDSVNRLSTVTQALTTLINITSTFTYDSYSDLQTQTNPDGYTATYSYDAMGNVVTKTLPDSASVSSTYTYTYDKVGNLLTEVTPLTSVTNATTSYTYDSMNRLGTVTDPLSNVTTYAYDSAGNLTKVTNALGNTVTYVFDNAGRMIAVTEPISSGISATTTYTLDAAGEVTAVKNPLSQITTYTYNSRGWLATVTNPLGNSVSYVYDAIGDKVSVTQADTHGNTFTNSMSYYDDTGLLKATTDAANLTDTYTYDADYNLTSVDGATQDVTYSYDALDRTLAKSNGGPVSTYGYDNAGQVTSVTDPLGNVTSYTYDEQGRLLTTVDPLGKTTSQTYDLAGRQITLTDPDSNTTTYTYNADNMVINTTNPNGYTATYSYDAVGELTSATDFNNKQTTYSYNKAGWLTGETWVSGSYVATYTYNSAGQMTGAADSNSTYTFTYYSNGQLDQSVVSYPGVSGMGSVTLTYSYDGFGNRTNLSDSSGGSITYTYNSVFQLASLAFKAGSTTANVSLSYGSNGGSPFSLSEVVMSGGTDTITEWITYSPGGSMGMTYSDTVTTLTFLAAFGDTTNNDGQITSSTGPEGSISYTYDADGQLTATTGAETYTYNFDSNGNRNSTGYTTTTGNEMTHDAGGDTLTYDHDGNLATKTDSSLDVWTYTWDYRNRLTQVVEKNSGGTTIVNEQMTYDVFNNLIGDDVITSPNGASQRWTVFDDKNPYIDFNGSGSLTTRYLTNPQALDQFFGRVSSGGTIGWYLTDATGSIREIVSGSGTVLDQINYDPFGNILYESNSANGDRFKFDGGEWDANLNLYHFGDRWQNPVSGGWISQDPIGFAAGDANLYRFTLNGPTYNVDQTGDSTYQFTNPYFIQEEILNAEINAAINASIESTLLAGIQSAVNAGETMGPAGAGPDLSTFTSGQQTVINSAIAAHPNMSTVPIALPGYGCYIFTRRTNTLTFQIPHSPTQSGWNAFNTSIDNSVTSVGLGLQGTGQLIIGNNSAQQTLGQAYELGPLGQTQNGPAWAYYGTRGAIGVATGSMVAAGVCGAIGFNPTLSVSSAIGNLLNCFPADTPVSTDKGLLPIQDVRASHRVWSFDLVKSEWRLCEVLRTFEKQHDGYFVAISVAGDTIESSLKHPYWVIEGRELKGRPRREHLPSNPTNIKVPGRWVDAGDLRVGDVLLLRSGEQAPVAKAERRRVNEKVYNFAVSELQCYAVGKPHVLVHNTNGVDDIPGEVPPSPFDVWQNQVDDLQFQIDDLQQEITEKLEQEVGFGQNRVDGSLGYLQQLMNEMAALMAKKPG